MHARVNPSSSRSRSFGTEASQLVMAGLVGVPARRRAGCPVPAISLRRVQCLHKRDARDKPAHDDRECCGSNRVETPVRPKRKAISASRKGDDMQSDQRPAAFMNVDSGTCATEGSRSWKRMHLDLIEHPSFDPIGHEPSSGCARCWTKPRGCRRASGSMSTVYAPNIMIGDRARRSFSFMAGISVPGANSALERIHVEFEFRAAGETLSRGVLRQTRGRGSRTIRRTTITRCGPWCAMPANSSER